MFSEKITGSLPPSQRLFLQIFEGIPYFLRENTRFIRSCSRIFVAKLVKIYEKDFIKYGKKLV